MTNVSHHATNRNGLSAALRAGLAALGLLAAGVAFAGGGTEFADNFADRQLLSGDRGVLTGSNVGATVELKEPQHGGKPGGRSVWVSWIAPADGVATFWTAGSDFDTLLSTYYFNPVTDTTLDRLREAARNDDDPASPPTSRVQFGVRAGVRYEVAVDGYRGVSGQIVLHWDFVSVNSPPPIQILMPVDRALKQGDSVTLTLAIETSKDLQLQWQLNGNSLEGKGTNLFIPSVQPADLGLYTVRISLGSVRFFTEPTELQINSEGQTNALARDKLFDAVVSPLTPTDDHHGRAAVVRAGDVGAATVRGFDGSQIFNTILATVDPLEPLPCGWVGGASYWFAYQAPTNGTIVLDTVGSAYDTVIAAYTFVPPIASYVDLVPVNCDHGSGGVTNASRVVFAVAQGRSYAVQVDGVNGGRGIAQLNYHLAVASPPTPPTLAHPLVPRTVVSGADAVLQADVSGTPPFQFQWTRGGIPIPDGTNATLTIPSVTAAQAGEYGLTVANGIGSPLAVTMSLRVLVAPALEFTPAADGAMIVSFASVAGLTYVLEQADAGLVWQAAGIPVTGGGGVAYLTNRLEAFSRLFRLRVE